MNIGVVGLGLIGGSLARALKGLENIRVLGYDIDESTVLQSKLFGVTDDVLSENNIGECDYIFVALYPKATEKFLEDNMKNIKKGTVVVDCAGVKKSICEKCFSLAKSGGFRFIGGHPMAGTQFSGFKYSRATMFDKASMILVPDKDEKIETLEKLKEILVKIGFKSVTITTGEEHDRIIAYTSQLAHVVSNAYVKSPNAKVHKGFSAGSYKDMTRVAWLNENMWTELFLENKQPLLNEIDCIINSLKEYRDAIAEDDADTLRSILRDGRIAKEKVDG